MTAVGIVRGNIVTLERSVPIPDGCRVRVLLEPLDEEEVVLSGAEQQRLWREWAEHGPHGPIGDDEAAEFPQP